MSRPREAPGYCRDLNTSQETGPILGILDSYVGTDLSVLFDGRLLPYTLNARP